ncbi:MAG: hypothetical protein NVSMB48_21510 [Marmoricola sp.]
MTVTLCSEAFAAVTFTTVAMLMSFALAGTLKATLPAKAAFDGLGLELGALSPDFKKLVPLHAVADKLRATTNPTVALRTTTRRMSDPFQHAWHPCRPPP